jgi:hypothetical protein
VKGLRRQSTKFVLVLNLGTARALGTGVPERQSNRSHRADAVTAVAVVNRTECAIPPSRQKWPRASRYT